MSNEKKSKDMDSPYLTSPDTMENKADVFIRNYFKSYDNKKVRIHLSEMYDEHAQFSICSYNLGYNCGEPINYGTLFKHGTPISTEQKRVHVGKKQIKNVFRSLPSTRHDFGSFLVDLSLANVRIVQVVVNGMFIDNYCVTNKTHTFQSFCRSFCISTDWRIIGDMLFVTPPPREMIIDSAKRLMLPVKLPMDDDSDDPVLPSDSDDPVLPSDSDRKHNNGINNSVSTLSLRGITSDQLPPFKVHVLRSVPEMSTLLPYIATTTSTSTSTSASTSTSTSTFTQWRNNRMA
ncbi:Nuclear transport factor 2, eukaryote,NTF2-like domain [Cinara cedri]|uniref:Nuclear transport factor 2, eukaryote,NTF2-like domain n=1 Tax=Cinara cedri TaxID=506608 RepID=A0A5E4MZ11_9HEMI|nr:Nuclear transport factor 2, eukaryote,NTF2-like domain [Cinara cedri]